MPLFKVSWAGGYNEEIDAEDEDEARELAIESINLTIEEVEGEEDEDEGEKEEDFD